MYIKYSKEIMASLKMLQIPGFCRSNFRHRSMHSGLKSLTSGGNCNSVDFMMF